MIPRSTTGPVHYVTITADGRTLGYLWASHPEETASFDPAESEDEEGYRADLVWLDRLRTAKK